MHAVVELAREEAYDAGLHDGAHEGYRSGAAEGYEDGFEDGFIKGREFEADECAAAGHLCKCDACGQLVRLDDVSRSRHDNHECGRVVVDSGSMCACGGQDAKCGEVHAADLLFGDIEELAVTRLPVSSVVDIVARRARSGELGWEDKLAVCRAVLASVEDTPQFAAELGLVAENEWEEEEGAAPSLF